MSTFDAFLGQMLDRAATEARLDGSPTVEAQHLLLAIAGDGSGSVGQILAASGLERNAIRGALDREVEHSLAAVGVTGTTFGLPPATPDPRHAPHPGASARLALERGVASGAGHRLRPAHLLLGILQAEVGTVPRALAQAGVDRASLSARVRESLEGAGDA